MSNNSHWKYYQLTTTMKVKNIAKMTTRKSSKNPLHHTKQTPPGHTSGEEPFPRQQAIVKKFSRWTRSQSTTSLQPRCSLCRHIIIYCWTMRNIWVSRAAVYSLLRALTRCRLWRRMPSFKWSTQLLSNSFRRRIPALSRRMHRKGWLPRTTMCDT